MPHLIGAPAKSTDKVELRWPPLRWPPTRSAADVTPEAEAVARAAAQLLKSAEVKLPPTPPGSTPFQVSLPSYVYMSLPTPTSIYLSIYRSIDRSIYLYRYIYVHVYILFTY